MKLLQLIFQLPLRFSLIKTCFDSQFRFNLHLWLKAILNGDKFSFLILFNFSIFYFNFVYLNKTFYFNNLSRGKSVWIWHQLCTSVCQFTSGWSLLPKIKMLKSFIEIPGPKSYPFVGTLLHYLPIIGE